MRLFKGRMVEIESLKNLAVTISFRHIFYVAVFLFIASSLQSQVASPNQATKKKIELK